MATDPVTQRLFVVVSYNRDGGHGYDDYEGHDAYRNDLDAFFLQFQRQEVRLKSRK